MAVGPQPAYEPSNITAMKHVTVYQESGIYAGWPANHGAWQWGDEFLVGFIRGRYGRGGRHNIVPPLEKVLARSKDGGESWTLEIPNVDFEAKTIEPAPGFDLEKSIIRVCGRYNRGGEKCHEAGGFYISSDQGKTWIGAFGFNLPQSSSYLFTGRTRTLGNLVFVS